jgi:hypothetical protein
MKISSSIPTEPSVVGMTTLTLQVWHLDRATSVSQLPAAPSPGARRCERYGPLSEGNSPVTRSCLVVVANKSISTDRHHLPWRICVIDGNA